MIAKPVQMADGAVTRVADPALEMTPERIEIRGDTYWAASANGLAITSVTTGGEPDPARGAIAVMVYRRAPAGMRDGMALLRAMNPDEADEIAAILIAAASAARAAAAVDADAALRRAAGKRGPA